MAFKIAVDAGHYLQTPGKRVDKSLDANQTREWTLNDRIARYIAEKAKQYPEVEVFRVDDPAGKKDVSLSARCKKANDRGADVYLSVHHNAGIKLGTGGGMEAFSYKEGTKGAAYRDEIYKACLAAGGLKGNRANPLQTKSFYVLQYTKAPAVLMEYGFMDSRMDAPVILTESYAKAMGYATMDAIAGAAGLKTQKSCRVELPVLERGDKTAQVKAMQSLLIGHGCSCGEKGADGSFGPATEKALKAFQKERGLPAGCCDKPVWERLLGVTA